MTINNKNSVTVSDLLLQIKQKDKEGFKVSSLKSSDARGIGSIRKGTGL